MEGDMLRSAGLLLIHGWPWFLAWDVARTPRRCLGEACGHPDWRGSKTKPYSVCRARELFPLNCGREVFVVIPLLFLPPLQQPGWKLPSCFFHPWGPGIKPLLRLSWPNYKYVQFVGDANQARCWLHFCPHVQLQGSWFHLLLSALPSVRLLDKTRGICITSPALESEMSWTIAADAD